MNSISILGRRSQTVIKITILSSFEVSTNLEARMNKQIPGTWGYQRSYPPLSFSSLPFLDGCRSTPFRFRLIQERLNEGWYCTSELDGDPRIATTPNSDISRGPDRSRARCWSVLHRNKSEIPHDTTGSTAPTAIVLVLWRESGSSRHGRAHLPQRHDRQRSAGLRFFFSSRARPSEEKRHRPIVTPAAVALPRVVRLRFVGNNAMRRPVGWFRHRFPAKYLRRQNVWIRAYLSILPARSVHVLPSNGTSVTFADWTLLLFFSSSP
jgi:hypothetical protein